MTATTKTDSRNSENQNLYKPSNADLAWSLLSNLTNSIEIKGDTKAFYAKVKADLSRTTPTLDVTTLGIKVGILDQQQWYSLISNRRVNRYLTIDQAKAVVLALAQHKAYTYQWEALETLHIIYPHIDFSLEEWRRFPLNQLEPVKTRSVIKIPNDNQLTEPSIQNQALSLPLTTGFSLIGRDRELAQARKWLLDTNGEIRVLTITGPGGMGKTSLALTLVRSLAQSGEYPDGVAWVDLSTLPARAGTDALSATLAKGLGLPPQAGVGLPTQLRNYLTDKRFLLALDNFEQVQADRNNLMLIRLLSALPGLQMVITSRQILDVANEQGLRLSPLNFPNLAEALPPAAELATNYSAVELFVRRAQQVEPNFIVSDGNARVIAELCQYLDGIPLAIAIAAARIRQFGVAGLLNQIRRHGALPILQDASQGTERHQSQTATIDWSYELLSNQEKRIWRGLSVFTGSVGLKAIELVLGEELSAIKVDQLIGDLVDKSMLVKVEETSEAGPITDQPGSVDDFESRYYLLGVMREYALDRMREQAREEERVREAHAKYYLGLAEEAATKLNGPEWAEWQARLTIEYENIKAALGWLVEKVMVEEAYRLAGAMGQYWYVSRIFAEGLMWLERVMELARAGEVVKANRARVLFEASRSAMALEELEKARNWGEESLAIWRELGNSEGVGRVLTNLGNIEYKKENYNSAQIYYEQALELARDLNNSNGQAVLLRNLGQLAFWHESLDHAKTLYEQGLAISQAIQNKHEVANFFLSLGLVTFKQRQLQEAQMFSHKALVLSQEIEDVDTQVRSLLNLQEIAQLRNDLPDFKVYCKRGLEIALCHNQPKFFVSLLLNFTWLLESKWNSKLLSELTVLLGIVDYYIERLGNSKYDYLDRASYRSLKEILSANLEKNLFSQNWVLGYTIATDLTRCTEQALNILCSV